MELYFPKRPNRNHDNDRGHIRPAAWKHMKACIADHFCLAAIFKKLEEMAGSGSVRLLFAAALWHWCTKTTKEQRSASLLEFIEWDDRAIYTPKKNGQRKGELEPPPVAPLRRDETLPHAERRAYETDFKAAMKKILAESDDQRKAA